jgi:prevent-host-death family protein
MQYNVLEARNQLSKLIEAALSGEEIVIAKRGKAAVRLEPVAAEDEIEERPGNPAWIAQWFRENPIEPEFAMTSEEIDEYLRKERDSWD